MNKETIGALKRIIKEVKDKRKFTCTYIDCVCNEMIGGNDIQLVETWINNNQL